MLHGKKPTRKQRQRLGRAGLSPDKWLIAKNLPSGEMVLLHKHARLIRVLPASVGLR